MKIHAYRKIRTKKMNVGGPMRWIGVLSFRNRNRKFEIATELFTPVVVANVEL